MNAHFRKTVDLRNRSAMIQFLKDHFSYEGAVANRTKFYHLGLPQEIKEDAWELLTRDYPYFEQILDIRHPFEPDGYKIVPAGRMSGYLTLYHCRKVYSQHKSYCKSCGQRNFQEVVVNEYPIMVVALAQLDGINLQTTIDNKCGRCGASGEGGRVNYVQTPFHYEAHSSVGCIGDEFAEESMDQLRYHVRLIQRFDAACDEIRENFIQLLTDLKDDGFFNETPEEMASSV